MLAVAISAAFAAAKAAEMATANITPEDTKNQSDQITLDGDRQVADLASAADTADPILHVAAVPSDEATGKIIDDADQASAGASDTTAMGAPQPLQEAS